MYSFWNTILLTLFLLLPVTSLFAQSYEEALELYQNEQFLEASELFMELDGDEAKLFSGKSHLALGNHLMALFFLDQAISSEVSNIRQEALFTSAITHFRLKNYARSLEILYQLIPVQNSTGLQQEAENLYRDILQFLNDRQRLQVFQQITNFEIRTDLIRSAISRAEYTLIQAMISELEPIAQLEGNSAAIRELRQETGPEQSYQVNQDLGSVAPQGMIYNIGVALPAFETDDPEFVVPRNLYFGIMLAAEEFNARHTDQKVFLHFQDTGSNPDQIGMLMQRLLWQSHPDALIGPLFSDTAVVLSDLARQYEIPLLAPLANSDSINSGHPYTFQVNPTFSVHGTEMARYAVQELQLDTLAVISESGSFGSSSAQAFRKEAEELGAYIAYYFEEDFSESGYDLSEITEVFTPDSVLIDSLGYTPVKGVYAPFTGQAAETLTRLFMTDLEAMNANLIVMGSEEWKEAEFSEGQRSSFDIYYSEPSSPDIDETTLEYFQQDFQNRFSIQADQFARIGYDTGTFLFQTLESNGNPESLHRNIATSPIFNGLSLQIHFNGWQINQAVSIQPVPE
ncbi:MAG: ABC transporter substrate-binding protein [Balneolaceae bacterium]